ncbi:MAG: hypothetical protein JSS53_07475 [Proteobacteria bacterium]|nr:hypothetical protein [Pseudomonadota bacterium]
MKIKWVLIFTAFLLVTYQVFSKNKEPLITKSTTYVLQRADIPNSPYTIGMGVGQLQPNAIKTWKLHISPELAYLLTGQVTVCTKIHGCKTTKSGHSYQIPTNIWHQTKAGSNGYTYLVVWGKNKGKAVSQGRSDSEESRKEIDLSLISQIAKHYTSLINIKSSKLKVLETSHIPQSLYDISLAKGTLAPNIKMLQRKDSNPEIFYVLNGELTLTQEDGISKKYIFGDSFKTPPNILYQIEAGPSGTVYLVIKVQKQDG